MRNIGGALDYEKLANLHRPLDANQILAEARRLKAEGHSDYGIAHCLRLDVNAVRRMLGQCGDCEE